jgi:AbrB family looped-hinge helix DNA binding protein
MIAKVSVKGQTVIPEAIREQARIKAGDELDVGYASRSERKSKNLDGFLCVLCASSERSERARDGFQRQSLARSL